MEDENEDEGMQTGGLGMSADPYTESLRSAFAAQTGVLKQQQALAKQRYEEGRQRIEQMRLGPTRSEQLMAISQALLSPSPYRNRFKGTLANLSQVAGPMLGANRKAELQRAEMLRQLTEQYEDRALTAQSKTAELQAGLAKALRPRNRSFMIDPTTGKMYDRSTLQRVTPPSDIPQRDIEALRTYLADPQASRENKMITLRNFQRTYGVDPIALLNGEM